MQKHFLFNRSCGCCTPLTPTSTSTSSNSSTRVQLSCVVPKTLPLPSCLPSMNASRVPRRSTPESTKCASGSSTNNEDEHIVYVCAHKCRTLEQQPSFRRYASQQANDFNDSVSFSARTLREFRLTVSGMRQLHSVYTYVRVRQVACRSIGAGNRVEYPN